MCATLRAAAATDAGYRLCRRCRPERALPMPEWALGQHIVRLCGWLMKAS